MAIIIAGAINIPNTQVRMKNAAALVDPVQPKPSPAAMRDAVPAPMVKR